MAGEVTYARDRDWFGVSLTAGTTYEILLRRNGSASDPLDSPLLRGIYDSNENFIPGTQNFGAIQERVFYRCLRGGRFVTNYCGYTQYTSRVEFTPDSTGTYYISASGHASSTGGYKVEVDTM